MRERNLNSSRYMETFNTEENSISMKWSVDNIGIRGLQATYLTLSFRVNRLGDYINTLFAVLDDEIDNTFETIRISGHLGVETILGEESD